ncbi:MAG: hypothetical protein DKT66_02565 [Candidatus Melainabacteria bacterium]|nr:MAG: hypothetical protein DKT66_02565 [Candidatus Melainabacteria bacterium]
MNGPAGSKEYRSLTIPAQGFPYGAIFESGGTINTWCSTHQFKPEAKLKSQAPRAFCLTRIDRHFWFFLQILFCFFNSRDQASTFPERFLRAP